jgi:carbonic anhydrase/acetyltransferase-like protein (isoleucine patch superfamily)
LVIFHLHRFLCIKNEVKIFFPVSDWWYHASFMKSPENKNIYRFMLEHPQVGARFYIDEKASVTGSVVLGDDVSVWPMAVIRGDVNRIRIGTTVPSGTLWRGNPARFARVLREAEVQNLAYNARHYVSLKDLYLEHKS